MFADRALADAPISFDPTVVRADFPALSREMNGHPLVYLDNAATSQKPSVVIERLRAFYESENANVHRGVHTLSQEATEAYEGVRAIVARFIDAASPSEIVFTRGTTESINLVAHGWARKFLQPGDEIVTSELEHHSNIVPWQMLRDERGIDVKFIPMLADGTLDLEAARELIGPKTKLLAISAMSNAIREPLETRWPAYRPLL